MAETPLDEALEKCSAAEYCAHYSLEFHIADVLARTREASDDDALRLIIRCLATSEEVRGRDFTHVSGTPALRRRFAAALAAALAPLDQSAATTARGLHDLVSAACAEWPRELAGLASEIAGDPRTVGRLTPVLLVLFVYPDVWGVLVAACGLPAPDARHWVALAAALRQCLPMPFPARFMGDVEGPCMRLVAPMCAPPMRAMALAAGRGGSVENFIARLSEDTSVLAHATQQAAAAAH